MKKDSLGFPTRNMPLLEICVSVLEWSWKEKITIFSKEIHQTVSHLLQKIFFTLE